MRTCRDMGRIGVAVRQPAPQCSSDARSPLRIALGVPAVRPAQLLRARSPKIADYRGVHSGAVENNPSITPSRYARNRAERKAGRARHGHLERQSEARRDHGTEEDHGAADDQDRHGVANSPERSDGHRGPGRACATAIVANATTWSASVACRIPRRMPSVQRDGRGHGPSDSENRTGTMTMLDIGTPAARAGSKDHRRTASSAAWSRSG